MPEFDSLGKLQVGEAFEFSATRWNKLVDAAKSVRDNMQSTGDVPGELVRNCDIVKVKNTSGSAVGRFGVLALGAPVVTPTANLQEFQQKPNFTGTTPSSSTGGLFGVLVDPLENNAIGRAVVAGVTVCQVNMNASTDGYASPTSNTGYLTSGTSGPARILWADTPGSYPGTVWAIVRIGADDTGAGTGGAGVPGPVTVLFSCITSPNDPYGVSSPQLTVSGTPQSLLTTGSPTYQGSLTIPTLNTGDVLEWFIEGDWRDPVGSENRFMDFALSIGGVQLGIATVEFSSPESGSNGGCWRLLGRTTVRSTTVHTHFSFSWYYDYGETSEESGSLSANTDGWNHTSSIPSGAADLTVTQETFGSSGSVIYLSMYQAHCIRYSAGSGGGGGGGGGSGLTTLSGPTGVSWSISGGAATGSMITNLDMATNRIINVVDPINPQDAATKNYVDTHGGTASGVTFYSLSYG